MIKFLKNTSGEVLRFTNPKEVLPVDYIWEVPLSDTHIIMTSDEILTAIRGGDLQVGRSSTEFYSDAVEGEAFLLTTMEGLTQVIESEGTITEYVPDIVSDTLTGKKTTTLNYGILKALRDLYNDTDNPLYSSGHTTLIDKVNAIEEGLSEAESEAVLDQSRANLVMSWAEVADLSIEGNSVAADKADSIAKRAESLARTADPSEPEVTSEVNDLQVSVASLQNVDSIATADRGGIQSEVDIAKSIALLAKSFAVVADSVADRAESLAMEAGGKADVLDDSIAALQDSISALENADSISNSEIQAIQSELAYLQNGASEANASIVELQLSVSNLQNDDSIASSERAALQNSVSEVNADMAQLTYDLTYNLSISESEADADIAQLNDNLSISNSEADADIAQLNDNLSIADSEIASLQEQLSGIDSFSDRGTERPEDLLIYYGWLNSFNSDVNSWTNEKVAQDMARYNILIFGAGIANSGHGDYANTSVIIPRIKELNPNAKIFGYVTVNQTLTNFQTEADEWEAMQVDGIFMDEAGYDFGKTRQEFNNCVDYVHGLSYANICFANCWNMDHVLGTTNDTSYPNTTYNASLDESNLTSDDWYLLESFGVNTNAYTNDYEAKADWYARGTKAINHRSTYGIKLASVGVIDNEATDAEDLFEFFMIGSMMFSLEAMGSSDENYGASSAKVVMWDRPDVSGLGRVWSLTPSVSEDLTEADAYIRFTDFGKLTVDFTTNSEGSAIVKN